MLFLFVQRYCTGSNKCTPVFGRWKRRLPVMHGHFRQLFSRLLGQCCDCTHSMLPADCSCLKNVHQLKIHFLTLCKKINQDAAPVCARELLLHGSACIGGSIPQPLASAKLLALISIFNLSSCLSFCNQSCSCFSCGKAQHDQVLHPRFCTCLMLYWPGSAVTQQQQKTS